MPDDVRGLIYGVARDDDGNALPRAEIRLTDPGTTDLVLLYPDRAGTIEIDELTQPVYADDRGVYSFGLLPGVYDLRIIGEGAFDKTFPGTYVDQVDWSWDRGGQIMLHLQGPVGYAFDDTPVFWESNDFDLDPLWDSENDLLVWTGLAIAEGGDGETGQTKCTYIGTDTKVFKVGLLCNAWADGLSDMNETWTLQIRKNGTEVLIEIPTKFSSLIEPTAGGASDSPAPVVQFGEILVELETDDYVEIWGYSSDAFFAGAWLETLKFWVTL